MVLYNCEHCNFVTNLKSNYKRHLKTFKHKRNLNNSLIPMVMNQNEPKMNQNEPKMNQNEPKRTNKDQPEFKKFKCKFCDATFNTKPSRRRHELHRCKDNNEVSLVNELQNEKKILYKQIEKLIEKAGNNTMNIHNTQNIQLNSYGSEDLSHITDVFKNNLLKSPFGMIPKMIEAVHFSDYKPENKNIKFTNKRDNKIKIFTNNKWVFKDKEETINDLMDGKYFILDSHYDKICEKNHEIFEKFQKLFDSNDKEVMEEQKKLCELVLLNNR